MIPVYVTTFNRLTTTRNLCEQIVRLDGMQPIVIDNASDYPPLLDWYSSCPFEVIQLRENIGHHSPWLSGIVSQDAAPIYGVTDCDISIEGVPRDLLDVLSEPLTWARPAIKSGMSLRIDDLPPWQTQVRSWESRWWRKPIHGGRYYVAPIDTTFALYQQYTPQETATRVAGVYSVRSGGRYVARHVPWYLDCENLDEENKHYFATANQSNSWRPNGKALASIYKG